MTDTANLALPRRYGTPPQQSDFAARWLSALQTLPGVKTAALTDIPPLDHDPSSIAGVRQLLAPDAGISAAWFHFLAFDLVFGAWMTGDGIARGIPRVGLIAVMAVTWFAGPTGFLAYLALRTLPRRTVAA